MAMRRFIAAVCAAAAMLGAAAPAFAGGHHHHPPYASYHHTHDGRMLYQGRDVGGYVDRYNWPTPWGRCIRMCANDNLPCDPIYFKIGDGRCTTDAR